MRFQLLSIQQILLTRFSNVYSTNQWWDNNGGVTIPYTQNGALGGTITFDIWTDHSAGTPGTYGYMLKLEGDQSGGSGAIENSFPVAGAGSWESVTVNLADCANKVATGNCSGQENSASTFQKIFFFTGEDLIHLHPLLTHYT